MDNFFRSLVGGTTVPDAPRPYLTLAQYLEALASETRLQLLHALRTPRALHEIRLSPSMERAGTSPDRPLTRQAVTRHLEQLEEQGLVHRVPAASRMTSDLFVLNHERLFAVVDELHGLSRLRPVSTSGALAGDTLDRGGGASGGRLPEPPRLVLVYGRDEGTGFGLHGPAGTSWRIGRAEECEVRLDYDPFLSSVHATVERRPQGFVLRDEGSRNGTAVNWVQLPKKGEHALEKGDILQLGRSLLVFHG